MEIRIVGVPYGITDDNGDVVQDRQVLRSLNGIGTDGEPLTSFLAKNADDFPVEAELSSVLEEGGHIELVYSNEDDVLLVSTKYRSSRKLSELELETLVAYTRGQWSDGAGAGIDSGCYTVDLYCPKEDVVVEQLP